MRGIRHRFLAVAPLALIAGLVAPAVAPAQRIPDRLADSTFWRMVTEFSEPNGLFQSDNFVSNEAEVQYVIPDLLTLVKKGGAYIGVGPEQNFTYIVAFQPRIAFICDIRRQNMIEHLMYKALIELSSDRADFLSRLWSRPRPKGLDAASSADVLLGLYSTVVADTVRFQSNLATIFRQLVNRHHFALTNEDSTTMAYVYRAFVIAGPDLTYSTRAPSGGANIRIVGGTASSTPPFPGAFTVGAMGGMPTFGRLMVEDDGNSIRRGWLSDEKAFRALKDFETRNLLVPIVGNFGGEKALRAVGKYLKEHGATVSVFYASNVEQYLFQQSIAGKFYDNVAEMPTDSTSSFIRSLSMTNQRWAPPRNPRSRMAQLTSSIDDVLRAHKDGRLTTYPELIELRRQ